MPETDEADFPLPPANFMFLVESIMVQTQVQLGIFSLTGDDENTEPNLPVARHSIDLLAMLQDKTRGNLSTEEQRFLENGLTELRFRYVQVNEQLKKEQTEPVDTEPEKPRIIMADGGKGIKSS